jgi:hypothetical protein
MQIDPRDIPLPPSTAAPTMPLHCPATPAADPIYQDPTPPSKLDAQDYSNLVKRYHTGLFSQLGEHHIPINPRYYAGPSVSSIKDLRSSLTDALSLL